MIVVVITNFIIENENMASIDWNQGEIILVNVKIVLVWGCY